MMKTRKKKLEKYNPSDRQKSRQIDISEDDRHCGNCCVFLYENSDGSGYCDHMEIPTSCELGCDDWEWINSDGL